MASDYRISVSFWRSRKTARLKRAVGLEGVCCLVRLWGYCAEMRPDGDLSGLSDEDIAEEAGWDGDAGRFIDALAVAGFLDGEPGGFSIHDWEDHQPFVVGSKARSEKARRAAESRWSSRKVNDSAESSCSEHARSNATREISSATSTANPEPSNAPANQPTNHVELGSTAGEGQLVLVPEVVAKPEPKPDPVAQVWSRYREHHPRAPEAVTHVAKKLISVRLREGWTASQMEEAIDGYHRSPWHTGQNPDGKKYLGIDLILRDSAKVQAGIEMLEAADSPLSTLSKTEKRNLQASQTWLMRHSEGDE